MRNLGTNPVALGVMAQMERDDSSLEPYGYEVALRIIRDTPLDRFSRTLAFVFHQGLKGQSKLERKRYIIEMAKSDADWQNYTSQGLPLTYNQELLQSGHATVEIDHLKRSLPGQGIELAGG